MFTGFGYNVELLAEVHNIRLLLYNVNIPILIQVDNLFQISYDLDQENLSCLTSFPTVWNLHQSTYHKMSPTAKQVGWKPRACGGQPQSVELRY